MPNRPSPRVRIRLSSTGAVLAHAEVADTTLTRLRGLLGRDGLASGEGMLLDPCSSVHTCFMQFPIDVIFIDRAGVVLRCVPQLGPFRFVSGGRQARRTIELPAGTLSAAPVAPGDKLELDVL